MPETNCIVYYHGNDWDGVPARQRYLMQAISRYCPVYYLDKGRDAPGRVTWHQVSDRITVVRGLARLAISLQARRLGVLMKLYAPFALRRIRRRFSNILLWTAEYAVRMERFVPHDVFVFDSIDPAFDRTPAALDAFDRLETEILRNADIVFASAELLEEGCHKKNPNVTLLNNACEPAEYTPELIDAAKQPAWWPDTAKPIAAFLGSLDWRFDVQAMRCACESNPAVHFILAGHIYAEPVPGLTELLQLSNVTAPGQISVEDGRYLLANCAIGLIPFQPGVMNDAINPVKLYTYALLGKPVLGTAIRELVTRPEIARVASSPEEFGRMIPAALKESGDREHQMRLRSFALENTWNHRADLAIKALAPHLKPCERQPQPGAAVPRGAESLSSAANTVSLT